MAESFEDLDVWKRACRQAVEVIEATGTLRPWSLRDQIQRSAISVPSNIAEGSERESTPEFIRFLTIAKGSNGELRTQLYIARRLDQIPQHQPSAFITENLEIGRMLAGLIKALRRKLNNP